MADDLPFRAEYAKTGRAGCKGCKGNIAKDSLRIAAMVQSPFFDGKQASWFHFSCFFGRHRPKTVADIAHFESLRFEDQEKISAKVDGGGGGPAGDKGADGSKAREEMDLKDFEVEYAKSGAAKCRQCEEKILKAEVRVGKKVYDSERAMAYGPYMGWHHVECFVKNRSELDFFHDATKLPGFKTLSKEDQIMLKDKLKAIQRKRKAEDTVDAPASKKKANGATSSSKAGADKDQIRKQSELIFKYRDQLRRSLNKRQLQYLLEHNNQEIPAGEDRMLDRLADGMAFGAVLPCTVCKQGQFVFRSGVGYQCLGNLTEWTKCTNTEREPKRTKFQIPDDLAEELPFLKQYKCKLGTRVMADLGRSSAAQTKEKEENKQTATPLTRMSFVPVGHVDEAVTNRVLRLGGKLAKTVGPNTVAVICTKEDLERLADSKQLKAAEKHGVQVLDPLLVEQLSGGQVFSTIEKNNLANWGTKVADRMGCTEEVMVQGKSGKSGIGFGGKKSMTSKQRVRLKGGAAAVDPDSGLEYEAHVYRRNDDIYNAVLSQVDATTGRNSYYKLQVLQSDDNRRQWVFRAWGRLGTDIGGTKLEQFDSLHDAVSNFRSVYNERTGNLWEMRKNFQKVPGRMFPMDLDYGAAEETVQRLSLATSSSSLPKPVQELICTIFDVNNMKQAMVELEIDLEKMPLGKLSKKQIEKAYTILTEAQNLVEDKETAGRQARLLDCTNRFYTLIPHDFGMKKPPLLDNLDIIKEKVEMVSSLMDIELAYNILKSSDTSGDDALDAHYKKLKSDITVLQKDSEEFKLLQTYVRNTHASTHSNYTLDIEQVFCLARHGEKARYKPFNKLHNRKLLWHGSRLTNFAGILSQGLRIAPPEAPVTGYMFGKGVYFADMVSKSANYCFTSKANPRGLLLLCEVALGNMYERTQAEYVSKLPAGKHSTKGLGRTCPKPDQSHFTKNKVEIPLGEAASSGVKSTSLLYNEYIVYDTAQINMQYLLQVNFTYKY